MRSIGSLRGRKFLAAAAAGAALVITAPPTGATPRTQATKFKTVKALRTTALLDIEGINVHSADGTTPYSNYPQVRTLLGQLGLTRVRDFLAYNPNFVRSDQYGFFNSLLAMGIHVDLVLSPTTSTSDLAARVATVVKYFPAAVDAIESPNEWNISTDPDWAADDDAYQKAMYADVKAAPALDHVKVLGPSLALREGFSDLGDLSPWLDVGNIHLYPGGRPPSFRMDDLLTDEKTVSGDKPEWVTETGYHDAMNTTVDHPPASDQAIAIYLPELFLDYYTRGVRGVYDFELFDEQSNPQLTNYQDHFGLVTNSGTRKPQFYAVANFNKILQDPGPAFTPGSLTYSVASTDANVQSMLLENSAGKFVLLLWQDAQVWNYATHIETPITRTPVQVQFHSPVAQVTENRPSVSASVQKTFSNASDVSVPLAGDVVALTITP